MKYLPKDKLGEMVKANRVHGILERVTSYSSSSTDGRCARLCTMISRTLGRSRAELTKHENELGEHVFWQYCCCHIISVLLVVVGPG